MGQTKPEFAVPSSEGYSSSGVDTHPSIGYAEVSEMSIELGIAEPTLKYPIYSPSASKSLLAESWGWNAI
ncbi:uncharacterized protein BDW70DRAFT_102956 [Aspergillus foveolatus]|uniref:uncharacterized protein n=1 Tax=Aspergillus foveolatus TaxID=210207 RepID=UPI003CCDA66B